MGLVPLSHLSGEVDMDDYGKAEIKFRISDTTRMGELFFAAMVFTGGETMEERPDYCVHLVENGDIIFNVMTPEKGEFVIKLTVKDSPDGNLQEFCDFLLISNQKDENGRFPKGFQERTENNVKSDLTFKQEAQTFEIIDETTDESMNKADTEEPIEESEKLNDVLRRRMCQSIEENSPKELSSVIKDMKALEEPSIQPDIIYGEESLQLLELKKELLERIRDRDIKLIEATLKKVKIVGLENKLEKEVTIARNLLQSCTANFKLKSQSASSNKLLFIDLRSSSGYYTRY
ncbi:uncharacterized protein LOC132722931 [Ruditapes philippinarum]|uniref:uncharacterized protein LOC132722931 n=1 Tax=Ruditapes philippinarum TaxID=129788 RepID=UPI00295BD459|nr:uncharacterized protein LOC132722931 [Ruditapes philippinarum]